MAGSKECYVGPFYRQIKLKTKKTMYCLQEYLYRKEVKFIRKTEEHEQWHKNGITIWSENPVLADMECSRKLGKQRCANTKSRTCGG